MLEHAWGRQESGRSAPRLLGWAGTRGGAQCGGDTGQLGAPRCPQGVAMLSSWLQEGTKQRDPEAKTHIGLSGSQSICGYLLKVQKGKGEMRNHCGGC